MKLDSILSLKTELTRNLVKRVAVPPAYSRAAPKGRRTVAFAARLDTTHTRRPSSVTVALGVTKGKKRGDFHLGARIQVTGRGARTLVEQIRSASKGEADIRIVPRVRKRAPRRSWFRGNHRPLEAGLSVGHFRITAGTLGFVVEDQHAYYVLSNNHVLADVNKGEPGDPVTQPGPLDIRSGGVGPRTLIGVLDRFVPISFQRSNVVDCAVAEILPDLSFYVGWTEALPGTVKGVRKVTIDDLGRPVSKAGRTTGVTRGRISQVNVDRLQVDMGDEDEEKIAIFSDQIEVEGTKGSFSDGGDSGSLIVGEDGFARALLFAGGEEEGTGRDLTYANQLHIALQKLGVDLAL